MQSHQKVLGLGSRTKTDRSRTCRLSPPRSSGTMSTCTWAWPAAPPPNSRRSSTSNIKVTWKDLEFPVAKKMKPGWVRTTRASPRAATPVTLSSRPQAKCPTWSGWVFLSLRSCRELCGTSLCARVQKPPVGRSTTPPPGEGRATSVAPGEPAAFGTLRASGRFAFADGGGLRAPCSSPRCGQPDGLRVLRDGSGSRAASEAKVLLKSKACRHELGKYVLFKNKQVGHFTEWNALPSPPPPGGSGLINKQCVTLSPVGISLRPSLGPTHWPVHPLCLCSLRISQTSFVKSCKRKTTCTWQAAKSYWFF